MNGIIMKSSVFYMYCSIGGPKKMIIKLVPIEQIKTDVNDLRESYMGPEFDLLVGSIRRRGLINPITCSFDVEYYIVIAGHRRLHAVRRRPECVS